MTFIELLVPYKMLKVRSNFGSRLSYQLRPSSSMTKVEITAYQPTLIEWENVATC